MTASTDKIQIVLVDDHPLFREGVVSILRNQSDIDVIGEGTTAEEGFELCTSLLPDILLLDINIPGGGLSVIGRIAAACPVTKIIMLTASDLEDDVLGAFKAGARGYILKGVLGSELTSIVRTVHRGGSFVTPSLAASLLSEMTTKAIEEPAFDPLRELSERERQILELVAVGRSNKEIGQELFLAEKTVKHHMTNILQKLQVRNRVEAALVVVNRGLPPQKDG